MYVCMYVCIYVCMYVNKYIYIYVYYNQKNLYQPIYPQLFFPNQAEAVLWTNWKHRGTLTAVSDVKLAMLDAQGPLGCRDVHRECFFYGAKTWRNRDEIEEKFWDFKGKMRGNHDLLVIYSSLKHCYAWLNHVKPRFCSMRSFDFSFYCLPHEKNL